MATVAEALALAWQQQRAGNWQQAEQVYRQVLQAEPANPDALHLLGILSQQAGQHELAVSYLQQTLAINPENASCHSNLGVAYQALGRAGEAEACFREALRLQPGFVEAQNNLALLLGRKDPLPDVSGQNLQARALAAAGRLDEARAVLEEALRVNADAEETYRNLGQVFREQGRPEEAAGCERQALIKELVNRAFGLGMLQIREEIERLADFIYGLAPRHVMEIGSHKGATFYLWCKLPRSPGKSIALDLAGGGFGGLSAREAATRDARMRTWAAQVYCINADSHSLDTYYTVKQALAGDRLDFLFIDGDHSYDGVKLDYWMYQDLVREGGYIAFHDINDNEWHRHRNCHVGRLWGELRGEKTEFNSHADSGGIGLIRKC